MPRTLERPRPPQGARLLALRQAAGLSQTELAQAVGETQQNIAFWEQSDRPPRSDVLPRLAKVLGVSVEDILEMDRPPRSTKQTKPVGKLRKVFDDVSKLPRRQQDKIVEVISAMITQYKHHT
jgi:transcriptional regulator with XRE-family HTH domain